MTAALFLIAIAILVAALVYGFLHLRADARRADKVDAELFWRDPAKPRLVSPVSKLERDKRLPFHGRVRQQIRVIPPADRN